MEKKLIFEEISRIHEMMGIRTSKHRLILNEGVQKAAIGQSLEAFAEGGARQAERAAFKTAVEDWADANALLGSSAAARGEKLSFEQMVKAGEARALEKGLVGLSEADAIAFLAKETGLTSFGDFTKRMTSFEAKAAEESLQNAIATETRALRKRTLTTFKDTATGIKTGLEDGSLSLATVKTQLEAVEAALNANTRLPADFKDTIRNEIKKIKDTIDNGTADNASVPSEASALKDIGDYVPEIKTARDLEQQTADAAAEAERLAQENAAQEAINAEKARVQKEFDDIKNSAAKDKRMGWKGWGGQMGFFPHWLGNDAKKDVMKIVNQLEEQYKTGTVTRQQILDRAGAEMDRLTQIAGKVKGDKANEITWLNRTMKKYPKLSWAIIIIAFASLGGITYTYRFAKDVKRQVELEDARQDVMDCFAGLESFEALDSDQQTKFSKIFNCRNRMQDEYPDSYISDIKYVKEEEGAPAEFIVTVGLDPNKVKKHYNANTGDEISTKPKTPSTTTSSKTVSDFETWLKNYASQIGYTYVDGSTKDLGNDSFEGKIKYGTSEAPIQRKWDGTNWVQ